MSRVLLVVIVGPILFYVWYIFASLLLNMGLAGLLGIENETVLYLIEIICYLIALASTIFILFRIWPKDPVPEEEVAKSIDSDSDKD